MSCFRVVSEIHTLTENPSKYRAHLAVHSATAFPAPQNSANSSMPSSTHTVRSTSKHTTSAFCHKSRASESFEGNVLSNRPNEDAVIGLTEPAFELDELVGAIILIGPQNTLLLFDVCVGNRVVFP
ncbi:hypothetical protein HanXRQr2_Chr08g0360341 [Helianthus annuus]|uniref:Uncharacterized protein n=1 Tax=Helianthus annuus TaxID=4232 RepID=A0A9K3IIK0_HELAN|nr:hypothetical protein HanXRQr2_Chr08g0360341 [Helianthus annuus]